MPCPFTSYRWLRLLVKVLECIVSVIYNAEKLPMNKQLEANAAEHALWPQIDS